MTGRQPSREVRGTRAPAAAVILGACLAAGSLLGSVIEVRAEKVGVAAAVNPDAFSSLSGTPNEQLNIGKSIFYNERIKTTASGLVQVLLIDGSTFTVGPNSNLVIDKFVYDPRKKTGEMVATFSKGTMRFIGGKLSKNAGGVKVNTPSGALAIRGGMFQGNATRGVYSFLYGESMTFRGRNGQTQTVYQPGYTLDLSGGTPSVRPTTPEDTNSFMQALASPANNTAGPSQTDQGSNNPPPPLAETVSLQSLVSDATATEIDDTLQKQETKQDPPLENTPNETDEPPPPVQIRARVLTSPGTFTAFPGTLSQFTTHDNQSLLGGDETAEVDDFEKTFTIENDRLVGTVSGLTDSSKDGPETISPTDIDFPAEFSQCTANGVCLVTDATLTENGVTDNYVGRFVGRQNFFAYHVAQGEITERGLAIDPDNPEPILAFGGTTHDFGTPSGRVHLFSLTPDVIQNAPAPFTSNSSTPEGGFDNMSVTPLALLEKDDNPDSRSVWLQTSFYIGSEGLDGGDGYPQLLSDGSQDSFVNVALGGMSKDGGLTGARRGGSSVEIDTCGDGCIRRDALAFTGDIATLAGPDGGHFLGTEEPNIVIGADTTGTKNIFNDVPLDPRNVDIQNDTGGTYHIGTGLGSVEPTPQQGGTFQGYAVGMVESGSNQGFTNVVASDSLEDVSLSFDPVSNTLQAGIAVHDVQNNDRFVDSYSFGFGDDPQNPQDRSAYIDDQHYAAIEAATVFQEHVDVFVDDTPGTNLNVATNLPSELSKAVDVVNDGRSYLLASATSYFVSGEQLNVTAYFPETFGAPGESGVGRAFCEGCDFMKWGAWGTRVAFGDNPESPQFVDNVHLGWWVAGNPTSVVELDDLFNIGASAKYTGSVIGNVASRLNSETWRTYVAAGDLAMHWDFGDRAGILNINNFDRRSYQTPITQPTINLNKFSGSSFTQTGGPALSAVSGAATGSFFRGPQSPAQGVGGNFNIRANNYKSTGIFMGSGLPMPKQ